MGRQNLKNHTEDLRDYTNTVAAVHLLKEALTGSAKITVRVAEDIVKKVNLKENPKISDVVQMILDAAGNVGDEDGLWVQDNAGIFHLVAAITIGGAVYTVDIVQDLPTNDKQNYTLNITSKLSENNPVAQGKLFFDPKNNATVKLTLKDGELKAVTKKGLEVGETSFVPRPIQNEVLSKFSQSLMDLSTHRLAILGTGVGKSIVMAGVAQAVGKTITIVPDKTLVAQQVKDVRKMHGAGYVNGTKVKEPEIFTVDTLIDSVDILWKKNNDGEIIWSEMNFSSEQLKKLQDKFTETLEGNQYEQIILQAEHPLFKVIAPRIKDTMILIDESHKHTFKEEDAAVLKSLKMENSILALTATPTYVLLEIFPDEPLYDLSLGGAIELGAIRPMKPEVSYAKEADLVTQAVTDFFNDYYLKPGDKGYIDPRNLKKEILEKNHRISDSDAEKLAINQTIELNRIRAKRNLAFSDDEATRLKLNDVYQKISNGVDETINEYKDKIATFRREAEIDERLVLEKLFYPELDEHSVRERITKEVPLSPVDLVKDIRAEQQKSMERTINSYAIALVLGEKDTIDTVSQQDRTHKLDNQLAVYDREIAQYDPHGTNEKFPNRYLLGKLQHCKNKNREELRKQLEAVYKTSPVMNLPDNQREIIINAILDKAELMVERINKTKEGTVSEVIKKELPVNLVPLSARDYSGIIDKHTSEKDKGTQLAQLEVGIRMHIVSDQEISTGVSIKEVLNVQVLNNFSPVIESDPNVINGTISGPQAVGRGERDIDCRSRVQQYIDERYKDSGLILTLYDMLDKNSAKKVKDVIGKREQQARKEELQAKECFAREKMKFFYDKLSERQGLQRDIDRLGKQLELQKALLKDQLNYLATLDAKLISVEKMDGISVYGQNPDNIKKWKLSRIKELTQERNNLKEERITKMEESIELAEGDLHKKEQRLRDIGKSETLHGEKVFN